MSDRPANLTLIREACIRANPSEWDSLSPENGIRRFGLADVLLAIQKKKGDGFIMSELFAVGHPARYNLREDNLESQSDETLQFIANILV